MFDFLFKKKPLKLDNVYKVVKKDLKKSFKRIHFKYEIKDGSLKVEAPCENKVFGDVYFFMNVSTDGDARITAMLDKVPVNETTLTLLNNYNSGSLYYKAYIDEFLTLENEIKGANLNMLKRHFGTMIKAFLDNDDEKDLLKLLTYKIQ